MSALVSGVVWFLLRWAGLTALLGALERRWPRRRTTRRKRLLGRRTDFTYFAVAHVGVAFIAAITTAPGTTLAAWTGVQDLQHWIGSRSLWLQVPAICVIADVVQYWVHRAFHRVPWLWRFHRIHHSVESLDWLAGSRLHLLEILCTRGLAFVPIAWLGFHPYAVMIFAGVISLHAVWTHVNARLRLGPLEQLIATPHFHHWHHAAEPDAIDTNFAAQFPWLDRLFGSYHAPAKRFPRSYGLIHGPKEPEGFFAQMVSPFRRRGARADKGSVRTPDGVIGQA